MTSEKLLEKKCMCWTSSRATSTPKFASKVLSSSTVGINWLRGASGSVEGGASDKCENRSYLISHIDESSEILWIDYLITSSVV